MPAQDGLPLQTNIALGELSESTQYMLGGKLEFKPMKGFVTYAHEPDGEMLVPGYIVSKTEARKFLGNSLMDSRKLEQSMRKVFEWLGIEYDMQRTEKGLWVGEATLERMLEAYSKKQIDEMVIGDLPGGHFRANILLEPFSVRREKH